MKIIKKQTNANKENRKLQATIVCMNHRFIELSLVPKYKGIIAAYKHK